MAIGDAKWIARATGAPVTETQPETQTPFSRNRLESLLRFLKLLARNWKKMIAGIGIIVPPASIALPYTDTVGWTGFLTFWGVVLGLVFLYYVIAKDQFMRSMIIILILLVTGGLSWCGLDIWHTNTFWEQSPYSEQACQGEGFNFNNGRCWQRKKDANEWQKKVLPRFFSDARGLFTFTDDSLKLVEKDTYKLWPTGKNYRTPALFSTYSVGFMLHGQPQKPGVNTLTFTIVPAMNIVKGIRHVESDKNGACFEINNYGPTDLRFLLRKEPRAPWYTDIAAGALKKICVKYTLYEWVDRMPPLRHNKFIMQIKQKITDGSGKISVENLLEPTSIGVRIINENFLYRRGRDTAKNKTFAVMIRQEHS